MALERFKTPGQAVGQLVGLFTDLMDLRVLQPGTILQLVVTDVLQVFRAGMAAEL